MRLEQFRKDKKEAGDMTVYVTLEEKDIEIIAWLLETRSKTHLHVFWKACILSIIVAGVFIYNVCFYEMRTTPQWVILLILVAVCIGKSILSYRGMIDYLKIAKRRTKPLLKKTISYTFLDEGILCENGNKREKLMWKDIKEWGVHNGYIFIMLQSNDAIIFDQREYEHEQMLQLKELLDRKLGQGS